MHFDVTEHPTAEWTAAQLMQAFPWDTAHRFLLRDRDQICGDASRSLFLLCVQRRPSAVYRVENLWPKL
ncbi:MAG: putative transposase [Bacteroidetes bacterium]|nr:putative transposase [Bacteroidota bacterium]